MKHSPRHEVRTIRGALLDRINIQAEPKSLDDIAADKERRGALRGAYLEEVKQKATRDLQRATAAAERKQATKAAEAARNVEEKAASASKVEARKASQDEKREADKETSLRDWLSKSLDCRILDRTHEALEREEVFSVADLAMFCALPRFNECLTALTREKVLNALKDEGLISSTAPAPPSPLGPDDSTPDWLAEASGILLEKPEAQVPAAVAAPAAAPAVHAVSQSPRRPSRRSQSFQRREQRAMSPRRGRGEGQREQPPSSGPISRAEIAPLGNLVCRFFLKGTCNRGAGCRFLHPSEGADGAASGSGPSGGQDDDAVLDGGGGGGDSDAGGHCFLCGAQGHWKRDCPLALAQKTVAAVVGGRSGRGAPLVAASSALSNAPTTAPGTASGFASHLMSTPQSLQPKSEMAAWKQVGTPSRSQRPRSASFGPSTARRADKTSGAAAAVVPPPPLPPPEMEASEAAPADGATSGGLKRSASLRRREQRKRAAEREKAAAATLAGF